MPSLPALAERLVPPLPDVVRQRESLGQLAHRPWPLPERPWMMAQTWRRLLFAHWAVDPSALERVVAPQLPLDIRDARAWIGITPFVVTGFRMQGMAPLPLVSSFPELNVRTYVTLGDKPGIHFLSLDAASFLAVHGARRSHRVPYHRARMGASDEGGRVSFSSRRVNPSTPPAEFRANYFGKGAPRAPAAGTLEHFLTERYCLYTLDEAGHPLRGQIHHGPWPLEDAGAAIELNSMTAPFGITLQGHPLLHWSARQDTLLWSLEPA